MYYLDITYLVYIFSVNVPKFPSRVRKFKTRQIRFSSTNYVTLCLKEAAFDGYIPYLRQNLWHQPRLISKYYQNSPVNKQNIIFVLFSKYLRVNHDRFGKINKNLVLGTPSESTTLKMVWWYSRHSPFYEKRERWRKQKSKLFCKCFYVFFSQIYINSKSWLLTRSRSSSPI